MAFKMSRAMTQHWSPLDHSSQGVTPRDPAPAHRAPRAGRTQRDPAAAAQRRDLARVAQDAPPPRFCRPPGVTGVRRCSPAPPVVRDPVKYKTEVCNKWDERQDCRYGTKCQYAHGLDDLRPKVTHHPHYRTVECKHFHHSPKEDPTCPWGVRCVFKHTDKGARDNPHVIFTGSSVSPSSRASRSPLITPNITPATSPPTSPPIILISPIISPTITSATTPFTTPPPSPITPPVMSAPINTPIIPPPSPITPPVISAPINTPIIPPISPIIRPTINPPSSVIYDDFMDIMIHKMVEDVLKDD